MKYVNKLETIIDNDTDVFSVLIDGNVVYESDMYAINGNDLVKSIADMLDIECNICEYYT